MLERQQTESRYDRVRRLGVRRIKQLRERGDLNWVYVSKDCMPRSEEYEEALRRNTAALLNVNDKIYKILQAAMQIEIGRRNSPTPEQAAADMCRQWLKNYPEAYAKIEHMRFVG